MASTLELRWWSSRAGPIQWLCKTVTRGPILFCLTQTSSHTLRAPCWADRDFVRSCHGLAAPLPKSHFLLFPFTSVNPSKPFTLLNLPQHLFFGGPRRHRWDAVNPKKPFISEGSGYFKTGFEPLPAEYIITLDARVQGVLPVWHMNQISITSCCSFRHCVLLLYNMT